MFFYLFFTALFSRLIKSNIIKIALITLIISVFAFWTYERNTVWQSQENLWSNSLEKSPFKPRPHTNLGNVYFKNKDYDRAEFHYNKALSRDSAFLPALNNIVTLYLTTNQIEKAEKYINEGLELEPAWVDFLNALAEIHVHRKEYKEAIHLLRISINTSPLYHKSNYHMGKALLLTGRPELAVYFLIQAAASQPENLSYLLKLAEAYKMSVQTPKAINIYEKILLLDPDHLIAHSNLGLLLTGYNNKLAKFHYTQAVELSPYSVPDLYNLANTLFREGEHKKAKEYYGKVISVTPELANAYNNLGLLMAKEGKNEEAIFLFKRALQILPGHNLAASNLADAEKRENTQKPQED